MPTKTSDRRAPAATSRLAIENAGRQLREALESLDVAYYNASPGSTTYDRSWLAKAPIRHALRIIEGSEKEK